MIKIGYLVCYDYAMLFTSLNQLYQNVDKIYLAIDIKRKTYTGNNFEIPDSFFEEIKQFDSNGKIEFYFDDFYVPELTPMQNEVRERNMLLKKMGKGWLLQLDVDEYIYDFSSLAKYLRKYSFLTIFPWLCPIILQGRFVTLFKKNKKGFFYIDLDERFCFITNYPKYTSARNNYLVSKFFSGINVIHQSWAREENEVIEKINNWSHSNDFDTNSFFELWKNLNETNYQEYINFHPLNQTSWDKLNFLPSNNIDDFIIKYEIANIQNLHKIPLISIFLSNYIIRTQKLSKRIKNKIKKIIRS
jgi:hypothetical protein